MSELDVAMESLSFTPDQRFELATEPERALEWIEWARTQRFRNPAAGILARFRSGEFPPDPNAWRGDIAAEGKGGPDYAALLRACEGLVRNTGHEYREEELLEEFARLGRLTKVGNGATLTDRDRDRLLHNAGLMRQRQAEEDVERVARDEAQMVRYYAGLIASKKLTEKAMRADFARFGRPDLAELVMGER